MSLTRHALLAPAHVHRGGRGCDDDLRRVHVHDVPLDDVVAEGMIEGGANHFGAAGHLRVARRIELHLIQTSIGRDDAIAGGDPAALAFDDRPALDVGRVPGVGAADDLVDRHRPPADAIGEPGGVRDFVQRVDVGRADRPVVAGLDERVLGEVVAVAAIDRLGLAGVERTIVVHLQRVVREERRRCASRRQRERDAGEDRETRRGRLQPAQGRKCRGRL